MDAVAAVDALRRFGAGLSQHARLITLASAQARGLPESLMVESFTGREAVNELFVFDVDALSVSTDLDLSAFIGEEMTITLLQPDGSRRAWHGMCTDASWVGADGGVARYRLRLEPALTLTRERRDSYIFQDRTVRDIVTELLSDYAPVRFEFDVTQELASRAICTQYRESDYDFLLRVLASEGLSWRFEHDQADDDDAGDGQAKHRLVIFDSRARLPALPRGATLRFHGVRATDTDDAIDDFAARRQVRPNAVSISSWDPAQLLAPGAEQQSNLDAGELPQLAVYDGSGERIASERAAADAHSALMLQALELDNKIFEGAGAVRRLAAGHTFSLIQHGRYPEGDNAFAVLAVEHEGRNNYQAQVARSATGLEAGTYRNSFVCVRDTVAIVPRATALPHAQTALGAQTAMVVGLADSVATTVRDHQVRVQFAWQRGQAANSGGMGHDTDDVGSAPGNERSGTWVRVAEALAGPNWGSSFTPRIGTEVLVDFIEGDIDRPVVVAQLYTGADMPPFSAGVDSGANHAGVLSGIHSHNFDGSGYNQWQLDDTPGQLRMRLATSTAATQLNLGYLIAQAPASAQRGAYRGSGFELRTDAWGVVRGGEGVLLSTSMRSVQGAGVTSTQFDASEALGAFKASQSLAKTMSDSATQQKALSSKDAAKAQEDFIALIDPKAKGKHEGSVNGQQAVKAKAGARDLDTSQPVEKFGAPIVLIDGAASVNLATPASTVVFAGKQLQWTTQGDLHMTAAHTVSAVAANGVGLFTHSGGIQAIAANGPVSLQAHTDQLEILADKEITVISVNDCIEIKAKQKIVLQAGQSSVTLEGGDITFACPGNFTVKGGQHNFYSGENGATAIAKLPDSRLKLFDEAFVLKDIGSGAILAYQAYRIKRADGTFENGITDELGNTHLVSAADAESIEIDVLPRNKNPFDEQIQFRNANGAILQNIKYELKLADGTSASGITDNHGMTRRINSAQPVAIVEAKLQAVTSHDYCCGPADIEADIMTVQLESIKTNPVDVGTSIVTVQTNVGESRPMTSGEIEQASTIFGASVDYAEVRVHNGEYLWFGMQPDNTAMTPNGEMYFNTTRFLEDFSGSFEDTFWFIHEMVHVWQYQLGYPVKLRGAFRIGLSYEYSLHETKLLSDYNMEAQGDLLADFWALQRYGDAVPRLHQMQHVNDIALFRKVLRKFIADPKDRSNLPGG